MRFTPVATYDGFVNPTPSVTWDGPVSVTTTLVLLVAIGACVAATIWAHGAVEDRDADLVALAGCVVPGVVAGALAGYVMRHWPSAEWSVLLALVIVVPIAVSALLVRGLEFRGLGGVSVGAAAISTGLALAFDLANRVTAGVPISISGGIVLLAVGGVWLAAASNNPSARRW